MWNAAVTHLWVSCYDTQPCLLCNQSIDTHNQLLQHDNIVLFFNSCNWLIAQGTLIRKNDGDYSTKQQQLVISGLSHVLFISSVYANHIGFCYDDAKLLHRNLCTQHISERYYVHIFPCGKGKKWPMFIDKISASCIER